ncbi:hypothetical protein DQ04_01341020 [Trypanosoma grayi]|uniref:hypothetical protein n=1 Tax=Trypanosoma grayi TaxID=71804 RepID=UPI0004F4AE67|nr:hypothetical protein DQ04_01341020 [Trypanosoma grayi]KEG12900.1 hypothetical protein DQ04_01341020 [Trypanosoma grayi]
MMRRVHHNIFSQTAAVERRKALGLPPVDEMQRFRLLVCCMFCSICTSLVYAFDLFTTDFANRFHLSVGDQSTISTVGLVFCYFTLPYGFLYDYAGPFPLIVVCFFTGGLGALLLALTFDGVIEGNVLNLSIFYALLNTCSGLIDVAYIVTLAETFPRNRGPVIALAKVMTSLGSSVLSSLSVNIFNENIAGFIYFIMALAIVVCAVASFMIVLPPYFINGWRRRGKTPEQIAALEALKPAYYRKFVPVRRLGVGYAVVGVLLVFFTVETPVVSYTEVSRGWSIALGVITIALVLCFFFMMLPLRWLGGVDDDDSDNSFDREFMEGTDMRQMGCKGCEDLGAMGSVMPASAPDNDLVALGDEGAWDADADIESLQDPRYGGSLSDNLKRPDIYLLFVTFVCQSALGVIVMYNASTISVAVAGHERSLQTSALYTAFLGVGSSLGRIGMGMFEAFVQQQAPDNRRYLVTLALPVSPFLAFVAGILLLTLPGEIILLPYIIVYFEEGVFAAMCALIFPCLYEGNHGVYYNIGFLTSVVSVIGFNRFLFGFTVDAKHDSLGFGPDEECTVPECVRLPIIVATCVAAVATVFSVIVHIRYSRFVRRIREGRATGSG